MRLSIPLKCLRATLCWLSTLMLTVLSPLTQAHHAFSSEFDASAPFKMTGTVSRVEWINPHSWIHVDATQADGTRQAWMFEGGTPNTLLRAGLTKKLLLPGTEVMVRGYQSKDRACQPECRGSGRDITFPDGRRIFMGSSGTGAPKDGSDPTEGGADQGAAQP